MQDKDMKLALVSGNEALKVELKDPMQDKDMTLDLVSGNEALKVELKDPIISEWTALLRQWEDLKTEKMNELAQSETACTENTSSDKSASEEEGHDEHQHRIQETLEVLARHRSDKRGRNPFPQELPYRPPKKARGKRDKR